MKNSYRRTKSIVFLLLMLTLLVLNATRLRVYKYDESMKKAAASSRMIDRQYGISIGETDDGMLVFKYNAHWILCNPKEHAVIGNIPQEHSVFNVLTDLKTKKNTGYRTDAGFSYTMYSTLTSDGILVVWDEDGPIRLCDCYHFKKDKKEFPGDPSILANIYSLILFGFH